jgi:hypothetical protein
MQTFDKVKDRTGQKRTTTTAFELTLFLLFAKNSQPHPMHCTHKSMSKVKVKF